MSELHGNCVVNNAAVSVVIVFEGDSYSDGIVEFVLAEYFGQALGSALDVEIDYGSSAYHECG